jgi:hypothetical protein
MTPHLACLAIFRELQHPISINDFESALALNYLSPQTEFQREDLPFPVISIMITNLIFSASLPGKAVALKSSSRSAGTFMNSFNFVKEKSLMNSSFTYALASWCLCLSLCYSVVSILIIIVALISRLVFNFVLSLILSY